VTDLFPGADYHRVVHTNDLVPHVPMISLGFNHAGTEVWYDTERAYKTCTNKAGSAENRGCSDTLTIVVPSAHKVYLGVKVTKQCDQSSPTMAAQEPSSAEYKNPDNFL
jgi:hypothetical protein